MRKNILTVKVSEDKYGIRQMHVTSDINFVDDNDTLETAIDLISVCMQQKIAISMNGNTEKLKETWLDEGKAHLLSRAILAATSKAKDIENVIQETLDIADLLIFSLARRQFIPQEKVNELNKKYNKEFNAKMLETIKKYYEEDLAEEKQNDHA